MCNMSDIKYTKFGKNIKHYDQQDPIWNYVALDPVANIAIEIRIHTTFNADLPAEFNAISPGMFDASTWATNITHEEITEKEFWAAYKMYLTRFIQHFKHHTNGQTEKTSSENS